jgi:nucleotide-binding universal stress UspA family protein
MSALIVVGVDGSAEAAKALEYAAAEAARREARLRVVAVFSMPDYWMVPIGFAPPRVAVPPVEELRSAAQEAAQTAVDELSAAHPDLVRQVEIEAVGVCGHPSDDLIAQSREADALVLGHRGRGAMASAILGSVGLSCVLRAHCPVTIVRPTKHTAPPAPTEASARVLAV